MFRCSDSQLGQLDYAKHIRRDSEVVLLFFYAPWCGQSIAARAEIEQAASRLSDQVLFVAINCWWNQGQCRKQKHFFSFPVIHLYHRSFGPIEYKGPMSAVYIEKFVRRVMKPLLYIPSQSELLDFLSNYEITEVALEYNNCHRDQVVERLLQHLRRVDVPVLESLASAPPAPLPELPLIAASPCCNTVVLPQWHTLSGTHNVCELCVNQTAVGLRPSSIGMPQCSFFEMAAALDSFYLKEQTFYHVASDSIECSNFLTSYSPFSYYTACCRTVNRGVAGFMNSEQDAPTVAFSSLEKKCEVDAPSAIPHIEENRYLFPEVDMTSTNFTGLSCRTNKTLNIYLLDSNLFWLYAERLGAPSSTGVKEFAAIVDVKEESHYILDPKQALVKFTLGTDVLLLYYAQWCGFCPALNHVFIQLARLLPVDTFTVARIDVSQNDLPWEFMVDRLPTVLFFPCNRKDLSVKYPDDLPITLPNLLRFILRHSDPVSAPHNPANPPTKECLQSEAVLQQGHISRLEREIRKLRAALGSLQRAQVQVEAQLSSARREEHRLRRRQQSLEQQRGLLRRHSEQLQALYQQKTQELEELARRLQELAAASESLLTENTWLKILLATMERKLGARDGADPWAPPQEAHPDHAGPPGAPRLPSSGPPPSSISSSLAAERNHENRTE
ncbi:Thioredoxin domain-containing protein 11 [Tupaia chinensis]|uniref:Thioredoxin domain-containing protein 11 n=1 Tax=Tupaia chinensis TaxID=246437 RepID=L9KXI8_TUPCH|nr:Thioredoxin domain-containing protein 11 [Tupaia chinensis]